MLVTKHVIDYQAAPYGHIATILAGTPVTVASNLPTRPVQYWVHRWEGMTPQAEAWARNYGFLVNAEDVCEIEDKGELVAVDSAGEETPMDIDGAGWPGDGSGTDDLADFNANEAGDYRDE